MIGNGILMIMGLTTKRSLFQKVFVPLQSLTQTTFLCRHGDGRKNRSIFFTTSRIMSYKRTIASNEKRIYLHIGPSGDSWIGDAIFAAKHNQPGYVKSIALVNDDNIHSGNTTTMSNKEQGKILIDVLENHPEWAQEIYDTECFPEPLLEHLEFLQEIKSWVKAIKYDFISPERRKYCGSMRLEYTSRKISGSCDVSKQTAQKRRILVYVSPKFDRKGQIIPW